MLGHLRPLDLYSYRRYLQAQSIGRRLPHLRLLSVNVKNERFAHNDG